MTPDPREILTVHEANMNSALRGFHIRSGDKVVAIAVDMPFDDILTAESDGIDGEPGEYEMAQRRAAIRGAYRYFTAEGFHPLKIMKRVWALGRGMGIEPFCLLTMEEEGLMFGDTKGAPSWRLKVLSGIVELCGMKGSRLPGQKSKAGSKNFSAAQMGNKNRKKKN